LANGLTKGRSRQLVRPSTGWRARRLCVFAHR
jgi:hypothetical protein